MYSLRPATHTQNFDQRFWFIKHFARLGAVLTDCQAACVIDGTLEISQQRKMFAMCDWMCVGIIVKQEIFASQLKILWLMFDL